MRLFFAASLLVVPCVFVACGGGGDEAVSAASAGASGASAAGTSNGGAGVAGTGTAGKAGMPAQAGFAGAAAGKAGTSGSGTSGSGTSGSGTSGSGTSGSGTSGSGTSGSGTSATCGDGKCEAGETCNGCPSDCVPAPTVDSLRGSDAPVFTSGTYDYSPTVMYDGTYRMWWCCGLGGDHICHAEASSLAGPWHKRGSATPNTYDDTFGPTGMGADFDGTHTCDPSIVRVDGTYYMYYGGIAEGVGDTWTRLGVARSDDGLSWTRLAGGKPIFDAARDPFKDGLPNKYGTGQPSVVFLDGWFYLMRTDTTGKSGNQGNGAGAYVARSKDPAFQSGVEELTAAGFVAAGQTTYTGFSLTESFAAEWMYADAIDRFVLAATLAPGVITVRLFDRELRPRGETSFPAGWTEEPALVRKPDGHAMSGSACNRVPLDVLRSVGPGGPGTWDLAWSGADLAFSEPCSCVDQARVHEGLLLESPGLPLAYVRGGHRLQFALAAPAHRFSRSNVTVTADTFNAIPFAASVFSGNEVLSAPGRPGAFHLDDGKLYPVSCLEAVTDNQSVLTGTDAATWDAYPKGPSLYCVK